MLEYRTSPLTGLGVSPSELLNKRLLRSNLPVADKILNQNVQIDLEKIQTQRSKSKKYYDKQAKERNVFTKGQSIMIKKDQYWVPGQVVGNHLNPRSYFVRENTDKILRRNSSFLRKNPNPVSLSSSSNDVINNSRTTSIKSVPVNQDEIPMSVNLKPSVTIENKSVPLNKSNVVSANDNNNVPDCDNNPNLTKENYITRFGRHVKLPSRFKD